MSHTEQAQALRKQANLMLTAASALEALAGIGGKKKPGPKPGQASGVKADGTPKKKPGPKPGTPRPQPKPTPQASQSRSHHKPKPKPQPTPLEKLKAKKKPAVDDEEDQDQDGGE